MKILLISPCLAPSRLPMVYNIGLGYVGAALREAGHSVSVLDIEGNRFSDPEVRERLLAEDFDVAAIGTLITGYGYMKRLTAMIREVKPHARIWIGNSIGSTIPETILREMPVDVVVIGEGEVTACELADAVSGGRALSGVNGIAYRDGDSIRVTPPRALAADIDSLPMPAWDLFDQALYMRTSQGLLPSPCAYIVTTRGCPYQCTYCYHPFQNQRIRSHSPARVLAEIRALKERYGIKSVSFADDLFTVDKRRVAEICRLLIDSGLGIKWQASARVNLVDPEMLALMKKAGCVALGFGVESASPQILRNVKKFATPEQAASAIRLCRDAGIIPVCSFMIGNVGETRETVEASVRFIIDNDLPPTSFFFATPYPGTELWDYAKAKGLIHNETEVFSNYAEQGGKLLVNLTEMSDAELIALRDEAHSKIIASYRRRHPLLWARDGISFLSYYISRYGLSATARKAVQRIIGRSHASKAI